MNYTKPKKIFIVDDDLMLTEAMKDYLTREVPHDITIFTTGEELIKRLYEKPEIIILDYHLNTVDQDAANGMEILQVIKKTYPGVHVIMLSGQEKFGVAMQTIQKGAEQYVIKDKDAFEKISEIIGKLN